MPERRSREPALTAFMPLVHQARRTIRNRQDGNPFATDESIRREIEDLSAAYLATSNPRVSRALKVELDLLETLI
jgi:hypothetical protein